MPKPPSTLPLHRLSASITSWFRLPEQGMLRYDVLCRGTAFCVREEGASETSPLYFFTCSHVAAPWRWPKLYPLPWLEHVREEHTRCVLHVTEGKSGRVLERLLLEPAVLHHDALDVCVLRLQDQKEALRRMAKHGLQLEPLVLSDQVPVPGHPIVSPGFALEKIPGAAAAAPIAAEEEEDDDEDAGTLEDTESGQEVQLDLRTDAEPRRLSVSLGTVNEYKDRHSRGFAAMDRVLGDGVCGAPVLDLRSEGRCVGMVEGIVPPFTDEGVGGQEKDRAAQDVRRAIANNAGFIYGRELMKLFDKAKKRT